MESFTHQLKKLLLTGGCRFIRAGKGDHKIRFSPAAALNFVVDGKIKSRHTATRFCGKPACRSTSEHERPAHQTHRKLASVESRPMNDAAMVPSAELIEARWQQSLALFELWTRVWAERNPSWRAALGGKSRS